jgi:hypothetical protein
MKTIIKSSLKILLYLLILLFAITISMYIQQVPVKRRFLSPFYLFVSFYFPYFVIFSKKGKKLIWELPMFSQIKRIGISFVDMTVKWIQLNILETHLYKKIRSWVNKPMDMN